MNLDEAFPLHSISGRIRTVILHEFQGRCPTVQEVAQLSDKQWLAVPGIGLSALGIIRSVTADLRSAAEASLSASTLDVELLDRLAFVQEELRYIRDLLRARMETPSSSGTRLPPQHRMRHDPDATHELRV